MQDDESLRKWKEQLLGSVDLTEIGGNLSCSVFLCFFYSCCGALNWNFVNFALNNDTLIIS